MIPDLTRSRRPLSWPTNPTNLTHPLLKNVNRIPIFSVFIISLIFFLFILHQEYGRYKSCCFVSTLWASPLSGEQCITGPFYLMPGRHKLHHCLSFELFCMLLPYINRIQSTPLGELIAVSTDRPGKKIFGTFLSCERNVRGKGYLFHFLRASTKVKASF